MCWHKGWALPVPEAGAAARGGPSCHNEAFEQLPAGAELSLKAPGSHKPCLSVRPQGQAGSCRGGRAHAHPAAGHTTSPASFHPEDAWPGQAAGLRARLGLRGWRGGLAHIPALKRQFQAWHTEHGKSPYPSHPGLSGSHCGAGALPPGFPSSLGLSFLICRMEPPSTFPTSTPRASVRIR